jgi:hypothetical protein
MSLLPKRDSVTVALPSCRHQHPPASSNPASVHHPHHLIPLVSTRIIPRRYNTTRFVLDALASHPVGGVCETPHKPLASALRRGFFLRNVLRCHRASPVLLELDRENILSFAQEKELA